MHFRYSTTSHGGYDVLHLHKRDGYGSWYSRKPIFDFQTNFFACFAGAQFGKGFAQVLLKMRQRRIQKLFDLYVPRTKQSKILPIQVGRRDRTELQRAFGSKFPNTPVGDFDNMWLLVGIEQSRANECFVAALRNVGKMIAIEN